MEKVLFKEEQRFTQWWMWLIIITSCSVPLVLITIELMQSTPESADYNSLLVNLIVISVMCLIFTTVFLVLRLKTEITETEIRVKYPPFMRRWRIFKIDEIERYEVRRYKPIKEYGGYGVRKNMFRKNKAFNIKGNIGLQLYLKNGESVLIGTQQKQAIDYAMRKMMKRKE